MKPKYKHYRLDWLHNYGAIIAFTTMVQLLPRQLWCNYCLHNYGAMIAFTTMVQLLHTQLWWDCLHNYGALPTQLWCNYSFPYLYLWWTICLLINPINLLLTSYKTIVFPGTTMRWEDLANCYDFSSTKLNQISSTTLDISAPLIFNMLNWND